MKMVAELPGDILYLICDELANQQQFGALFSCCTASKQFAGAAFRSLYR